MTNKKKAGSVNFEGYDKDRLDELNGTFVMSFPPCFSDQQMEQLKSLLGEQRQVAGLGGSMLAPIKLDDIRRSEIRGLDYNEYKWVYDAAWKIAKKANEKYRFDIKPIREQIQLSMYDESIQGFYTWHPDCNIYNMSRKISMSIPLSSPAEYVGGELQFMIGGEVPMTVAQPKGGVIVFPSYELHRVTPVSKGRRYSLVVWVGGPNWR